MRLSRRRLLTSLGALGLAGSWPRGAQAAATPRRAVALVFMSGGFNALHVTPHTLRGHFSTTDASIMPTGTGLFVDRATLGGLSTKVLQQLAVVGVDHGITAHDPARAAIFSGASSYPLALAAAMGGRSALKCAHLGPGVSGTSFAPVGGVSMTPIDDVETALRILVGSTAPREPTRAGMARGLALAERLSQPMLAQNPRTLATTAQGYRTVVEALEQPPQALDWAPIAEAYGLPATTSRVETNPTQFAAAELLIRGGTNVVLIVPTPSPACGEAGWDTHGDGSGSCVRAMFADRVARPLGTFLERSAAMTDVEVTTLVFGEFGRDPELSDHARCLAAGVFGPRVRPGSTGPASSDAQGKLVMPAGTPGNRALWALLAQLGGAEGRPFGDNPHAALVA